jgi:hypothetical protein
MSWVGQRMSRACPQAESEQPEVSAVFVAAEVDLKWTLGTMRVSKCVEGTVLRITKGAVAYGES